MRAIFAGRGYYFSRFRQESDNHRCSGSAAFWVLSKLPLDTLNGLEALCHEYGSGGGEAENRARDQVQASTFGVEVLRVCKRPRATN